MPLVSLELQNVRVYERIQLELHPRLNVITGANASGKTTLLEAIHLLGTGRSFRTTHTDQLRKSGALSLGVIGTLEKEGGGETLQLGFFHGTEGKRASINRLVQKQVSSLAIHLPLQIISPDTHYEFQQNAKHRRGVLDWGLFHVEPNFRDLWTRYQRVLLQRNAALKDRRQTNPCHIWDKELIEIGEDLHSARAKQVAELLPHYQSCCQQLLGEDDSVELVLDPGWDENSGFGVSLRQDRARDMARGFTHSGPQRADLRIRLNSKECRWGASHGQIKILVIALRLAQIRHLLESRNSNCCLLIDDLAAELDANHRRRLTNLLLDIPMQIFVTAMELSSIDRQSWPSHKTFHVEHGQVEIRQSA